MDEGLFLDFLRGFNFAAMIEIFEKDQSLKLKNFQENEQDLFHFFGDQRDDINIKHFPVGKFVMKALMKTIFFKQA